MSYNVAVVGATGSVGRTMVNILSEREFPIKRIYAIASDKSKGKEISFGNKTLIVEALKDFDFSKVDIALFSPGGKVSAEFAPIAAKHCVVIDNTSYFRMNPDIPLIVPEVNLKELEKFKNRNIISNPNCATIQLVMALAPLNSYVRIKRVVLTTFQSVSGVGKSGMDELFNQSKATYMSNKQVSKVFNKQIAFNIIPKIGNFTKNGDTEEECKIVAEVRKILNPAINVTATCVRVPIFIGHSESANIEFESPISSKEARGILRNCEGISIVDDPKSNSYMAPIDSVGYDEVYVSRIREDLSTPNSLNMWIVSDNLRKGAALNAIQIAEELVKNYI
jgi:aspartate-semialdehyde dehydrogenase